SIRDDIMRAMETIQNQIKCIKFKQRDPETRDYAFLTKKTGCWSFVGRQGGSQQVSLDSTCFAVGVIIHELIHVIGFWHEHSRSDRDEYIQILWENIIEDQKSNFQKFDIWDNNLLGETFDYDSIMMYGLYTFSKDGASQTMKAIQENVTILPVSSKVQLSDSDIRRIKKLYECDGMIRPPVPDVPPTKCDFELDYCHMSNQMDPGLALWKRIRGRMGSLKGDHTT
ncbi:zinc metalloproteinase nas-4-like, partial [Limulus polyphemus]|uniref:Metalloendopeptidase n=1 Tax=Limulus polyphemus TaxID=6850 RepID=A0ABM1RYZ3_LIMPO